MSNPTGFGKIPLINLQGIGHLMVKASLANPDARQKKPGMPHKQKHKDKHKDKRQHVPFAAKSEAHQLDLRA